MKKIKYIILVGLLLISTISFAIYSFQQRNLINEQTEILVNQDYKLNQQFQKEVLAFYSEHLDLDNILDYWQSIFIITYLADDNNRTPEYGFSISVIYTATDEDQYNLLDDIRELIFSARQVEHILDLDKEDLSKNDLDNLIQVHEKLKQDIQMLQERMTTGFPSVEIEPYNEQAYKDKEVWKNILKDNISDIQKEFDSVLD